MFDLEYFVAQAVITFDWVVIGTIANAIVLDLVKNFL